MCYQYYYYYSYYYKLIVFSQFQHVKNLFFRFFLVVFCGFVIVIIFLVLYEERKNHSYYAGRGFDNFSSIFFGYLAAAVIKTTHIN